MFGFSKKEPGVKVIDKVWLSTEAKWRACQKMLQLNADCLFIAWFPQTKDDLEKFLKISPGQPSPVLQADQLTASPHQGMIVFVEHHPALSKEALLFGKLGRKEIPVLSALDEPLLLHFGGEKITEMMKKLGMNEDEPVGNSLVTKAIGNAQEKLAGKVTIEKNARSQGEWFVLNLPDGKY